MADNEREALRAYQADRLFQMCLSVLESDLTVLAPEPRQNLLIASDCVWLSQHHAEELLHLQEHPQDRDQWVRVERPLDDEQWKLNAYFDVCMQLHEENQGWPVTHGYCVLMSPEVAGSRFNFDRLFNSRKPYGDVVKAEMREHVLDLLPQGSSLVEA